MVEDRFGTLIQELSTAMKIKLGVDARNACQIRYKDKLAAFLCPDTLGEEVQILINVGKPGDGKYRENLLREALRANGTPPPHMGIFAYANNTDALLLFHSLPIEDLTGDFLADILNQLVEKARLWRDSISRGELPPYQPGVGAHHAESPFGLR